MADQASKAIATRCLKSRPIAARSIGGVRLRLVVNRRYPWGSTPTVRAMAIAWCFVVAGGCAIAREIEMPCAPVALGAGLGGAAGNLIDGMARGGVIDFIDLRVWPIFNLADVAIVAGALLSSLSLLCLR